MSRPLDIYVRVSRVGGREHLISPDEQERRGRQLAAERGLVVGEVLVDLDESGGKWDRPGLQKALERVRAKQSGGLIVAWLDRLSRDSEHAHRLVREITEAGGALYAPDAPADFTNPEGRLHAGLVFTFAQYVRERARESFARSCEQSIANGVPISSRVAAGYERGEDRRLRPSPSAPAVREAFELRAAGEPISVIADFLAERGVRTSFGASSWSIPAVKHLLSSRVYLGEIHARGFVKADAHEPLVDIATWTAAQAPKRARGPRAKRDYLLAGLVRCQACGYTMTGGEARKPSRGRSYPRYQCSGRHPGGRCPNPGYAPMGELDEAVERIFLESPLSALELEGEQPAQDLAPLAEALEVAERRLAQVLAPEMQDAAGDAWSELVRERRAVRDAAAAELGSAKAASGRKSLGVTDARQQWAGLSVAQRRAVLADIFDTVAVRKISPGRYDVAVFRAGHGPDVPTLTRARSEAPRLRPIDIPDGARVATKPAGRAPRGLAASGGREAA